MHIFCKKVIFNDYYNILIKPTNILIHTYIMSSKIATIVHTKHFGNASITTVTLPSEDSSLSGCYPFPKRLLKNFFYRALKKDSKLRFFRKYFKTSEAFDVLKQGDDNYPYIYCTSDENGNLFMNYQFENVKGNLIYVEITFPKDGDYYYVPTVKFIVNQEEFTIDIAHSFFSADFKLTKEQVLNSIFSYLGELALIRFLDYFVNTRRENDYNKRKILSKFMVKYFRYYDITYDIPTKTFFIKPNDNKKDFIKNPAYVRLIGIFL